MKKSCYNYSLDLLAKQDYSIYKINQKLKQKEFSKSEIQETIDLLIQKNLLREENYINIQVQKLIHKGYSSQYIIQKLECESIIVSSDIIEQIRKSLDQDEIASTKQLIRKKISGKKVPTNELELEKFKSKIMYYLGSKGYSIEESKHAINEYLYD